MRAYFALTAAAALAACSAQDSERQAAEEGPMVTADASAETVAGPAGESKRAPLEVSVPQLAYAWSLGFIVPEDKLASAQDTHRGLCEQMGAARCQILALGRGTGTEETGAGSLKLRVASSEARAFSNQLSNTIADLGGRSTETKVEAEDASKAIVDTEARIKQRELLVMRLTEVLRHRAGKVGELVEAERSVAEAQEELDQARGWLRELRGRVAMSEFDIRYMAVAPSANANSVGAQLGDATQASAANFLIGLRAVFTLAIYLLPWGLLAFPVIMLVRWFRRKRDIAAPQA
ncbi:DUF4349 domain-containing protein [Sphingomonas sp.]|jgi:hypothetical protein|uniref:DUF4349 domain-containing protein n=1 Tax=Sphingomonas sp. TaxID=28214 RepID=UPI002ED78C8C